MALGVGVCAHSLRAGLRREGTRIKMQIQSWVLGMKWKPGAGGAEGASSQGEGTVQRCALLIPPSFCQPFLPRLWEV